MQGKRSLIAKKNHKRQNVFVIRRFMLNTVEVCVSELTIKLFYEDISWWSIMPILKTR